MKISYVTYDKCKSKNGFIINDSDQVPVGRASMVFSTRTSRSINKINEWINLYCFYMQDKYDINVKTIAIDYFTYSPYGISVMGSDGDTTKVVMTENEIITYHRLGIPFKIGKFDFGQLLVVTNKPYNIFKLKDRMHRAVSCGKYRMIPNPLI